MNWKVLIFDDHCADIVAQVFYLYIIYIIEFIIIYEFYIYLSVSLNWKVLIFDDHCADIVAQVSFT